MDFETPVNLIDYDHSKWALVIESDLLDGPLTVDGLHTLTAAKTNPNHSVSECDSGMACFNVMHSRTGGIDFEVFAASPSNAILNQLKDAGAKVSFSATNPTLPGTSATGKWARFEKPADVKGEKETGNVAYRLITTLYKSNIGSALLEEG